MKTWLYFVLALAALQFAGFSPFGAAYSLVGRTVGIALPRTEHDTCDDSIVTAMKNVTTDFNQVRTCLEAELCLAYTAIIGDFMPYNSITIAFRGFSAWKRTQQCPLS